MKEVIKQDLKELLFDAIIMSMITITVYIYTILDIINNVDKATMVIMLIISPIFLLAALLTWGLFIINNKKLKDSDKD